MENDEVFKDPGYTFRDRIVVLETQVRHMISDLKGEAQSRAEANGERRVELANLNAKIDSLETKLNNKIDNAIEKLNDNQQRMAKILYIGVGIGVALQFILAMVTAFKK